MRNNNIFIIFNIFIISKAADALLILDPKVGTFGLRRLPRGNPLSRDNSLLGDIPVAVAAATANLPLLTRRCCTSPHLGSVPKLNCMVFLLGIAQPDLPCGEHFSFTFVYWFGQLSLKDFQGHFDLFESNISPFR